MGMSGFPYSQGWGRCVKSWELSAKVVENNRWLLVPNKLRENVLSRAPFK